MRENKVEKVLRQENGAKKRSEAAMKQTAAQLLLATHLKELGFETVPEYAFCPGRRWKSDLACLPRRILFEVDGHFQGKHGAGWGNDNEKSNTAQLMGYRVLRFTNREVLSGWAKGWLKEWLG